MLYLTGSWGNPALKTHLDAGTLGLIATPAIGNRRLGGWIWAADNGCFNERTYVGDERWWEWLSSQNPDICLFATAPDVMGDHEATLKRSLPWLSKIRALGFPAAFVFQNGATVETIPWEDFDVAFIGGDDAFKLGGADALIAEAQRRGKRVHVGRVNSQRRYERFAHMGVDSCDGTFVSFGPDVNIPKLLSWVRKVSTHDVLFRS